MSEQNYPQTEPQLDENQIMLLLAVEFILTGIKIRIVL